MTSRSQEGHKPLGVGVASGRGGGRGRCAREGRCLDGFLGSKELGGKNRDRSFGALGLPSPKRLALSQAQGSPQ